MMIGVILNFTSQHLFAISIFALLNQGIVLQVVETIGAMFIEIFKGLQKAYQHEIETVAKQYPSEPFEFAEPALILKLVLSFILPVDSVHLLFGKKE